MRPNYIKAFFGCTSNSPGKMRKRLHEIDRYLAARVTVTVTVTRYALRVTVTGVAGRSSYQPSLVPRPVRAILVTRGGLEPSAIARGLAKNGKKVPDRREKVPDNFSTKILCFLGRSRNISDS